MRSTKPRARPPAPFSISVTSSLILDQAPHFFHLAPICLDAGAAVTIEAVGFFSVGTHGLGDDFGRHEPVAKPASMRASSSLRRMLRLLLQLAFMT